MIPVSTFFGNSVSPESLLHSSLGILNLSFLFFSLIVTKINRHVAAPVTTFLDFRAPGIRAVEGRQSVEHFRIKQETP